MVQVAPVFAGFLAGRGAATLDIAPGVTTPLRFSDTQREHLATRHSAGLFDFSFICCIEVTGTDSRAFLNTLQTRAVDTLPRKRIAYTLLLRDNGSVLIDATLWHLDDDHYWLFVGRRSDFQYITRAAHGFDVVLADISADHAVIAVQGPASRGIIERAFGQIRIPALPYYGFTRCVFAGTGCWLARIGYSGETGYELVIADAAAPALWEALRAAGEDQGLLECGFHALDTLRIEAGHILFTHELATSVTPIELGLARFIDFYRPDFIGAQALRAQRWQLPPRRLVGLLPHGNATVDTSMSVPIKPGSAVVTSICRSPLFERDLAIGFVHPDDAYPGSLVRLAGGACARVARLPFYDPARSLPRRAP
jgi:aminomethyltransferase